MSSENDVPLGGESRRYYEQKFGDRIRKVSKGGGSSQRGSGGGSNWNGRAGAGAGLAIGVIFIIIRIVLALSRSQSSTPSYTYTPPPQVKFDVGQKERQQAFPPNFPFQPEMNPEGQEPDPSLKEEDVPVLEGLCFRIHDESLEGIPTPGRRIWMLLDGPSQKLLVKAASGQALDKNEKDRLIEGLNRLLPKPILYDGVSFARVGEVAPLRLQLNVNQIERTCRKYNRSLLEKCYPEQIVPYRERNGLAAQDRQAFQMRAQTDLEIAKLQRLMR